MKRSALMIVAQGQPFIGYQLANVYDLVDELVIVEGPDPWFEQVIGAKRSTDGTIQVIKSFPDPEKKIKMIHTNLGKNQMIRAGMGLVTGDYIYQIDVDEFLAPDTINTAFEVLELSEPDEVQLVQCSMHWYYKWPDVKLVTDPAVDRPQGEGQTAPRFWRNRIHEGLIPSHIPNTGYRDIKDEYISGPMHYLPGHYGWHYLALYLFQVMNKMRYYALRGDSTSGDGNARLKEWFETDRSRIGQILPTYGRRLELCDRKPLFDLPIT